MTRRRVFALSAAILTLPATALAAGGDVSSLCCQVCTLLGFGC